MKFLHSGDWHLGRLFHGVHLTEDQSHVLDQLVELAADAKVDAVLISGDIFDRAVPPTEAVAMLDDVLARLVLKVGVAVIVIAGNHDSPERLGFGSRLLANGGLHIFGSFSGSAGRVTLYDDQGPVDFFAVPYAEPPVLRERLGDPSIHSHHRGMQAVIDRLSADRAASGRSVLLAHTFVMGGSVSDSERPLSVGGAEAVEASCFDGFDYVALGHLHQAQQVSEGPIHYAGSLLKYSFKEAHHVKSVNVVDINGEGKIRVEQVPLRPRRDVRRIEGMLEDLVGSLASREGRDDYIMASLLDTDALLDVMGRLRQVYPNCLHVERPGLLASGQITGERIDHRQVNDVKLFADFFRQVTGEPIDDAQLAAFRAVVDRLQSAERESSLPASEPAMPLAPNLSDFAGRLGDTPAPSPEVEVTP